MASPTALVTGATGYVGSHVVRRLLAEGWAVHAIVRLNSNRRPLEPCHGRVILHTHDGSTNGMLSIVGAAKPDVVFHLASVTQSAHHPEDVVQIIQSNITFGTQLLEAMTQCGVRRFINTETFWQHYQGRSYSPVCLYAATKQAFRDVLQFYCEASGISTVSLLLYDTYGPDDPRPKLFNLLKAAAQSGTSLDLTPGEQLIDLVHVEDVVAAFSRAAGILLTEEAHDLATYAVSSGQPLPLKQVVEIFAQEVGMPVRINWGGRPYRPREVMRPWSGSPRLPGWEPSVAIQKGVRDILRR